MSQLEIEHEKAEERHKKPPGFWASRVLTKIRREYKDLRNQVVKVKNNRGDTHEQIVDMTEPSILFFVSVFGEDNIALTLRDLDGSDLRVAHFFYHLGRRHERSFFK